jgi:hypothetical protein
LSICPTTAATRTSGSRDRWHRRAPDHVRTDPSIAVGLLKVAPRGTGLSTTSKPNTCNYGWYVCRHRTYRRRAASPRGRSMVGGSTISPRLSRLTGGIGGEDLVDGERIAVRRSQLTRAGLP